MSSEGKIEEKIRQGLVHRRTGELKDLEQKAVVEMGYKTLSGVILSLGFRWDGPNIIFRTLCGG